MQASIATQSITNINQQFPGAYRCSLLRDGSQVASQLNVAPGPFSFTLANPVPVGSYTATAERLNVGGQSISPLVTSAPLVVTAPESFDAPLTVTLTL